jgi:broad specificity phosphatase PhoE
MALVFLTRHGQASFGSSNYDRLSDLGHQQSKWLGEYFALRGIRFSKAVAGTLERQHDTASGILQAMNQAELPIGQDAGLNEYHAEPIFRAFTGKDPLELQNQNYREYWQTFRKAMAAWTADEIKNPPETWGAFGERMQQALTSACANTQRDDNILIVSSGGAISRGLADVLEYPPHIAIELNLQFRNTAFCEIIASSQGLRVINFNTFPHLDTPDRRDSITSA